MSKAASPIRLQAELMHAAAAAASRQHRSSAQQIEYWAALGQRVERILDADTLLEVTSGLKRIEVLPVETPPVDPDALFESLEAQRKNGSLPSFLNNRVRFQADPEHSGYLQKIDAEGSVTLGQFRDGQFVPMNPKTR